MESEFFGHRKGSFTGAVADQPGLFQAAHGGTLFLRCAQEVPVDVRILSATHKDLAPLATDGRFRQDLYYRINVIDLHVPSSCTSPPLRARREDMPDLAGVSAGGYLR